MTESFADHLDSIRNARTREEAAAIRSRLCWQGERGEITREEWRQACDVFNEVWGVGVLGTWSSDRDHGE
jgi:hypothetical protein